MNAIITSAAVRTMTSLEIAEVVQSNHADVRRSIERLAERGVVTLQPLAEVSNPGPGPKTIKVYHVNKRDSYVIVAQLSPEFTAALIDRWQELEAAQAAPAPINLADPASLRHILLSYTERVIELEATVAEQAPKVAALDRIQTGSDGSFCLTDAAKVLQVPPRKFMARLQQMGWIHRRPMGSGWLAYQERITAGVMEHKVTTGDKSDGTEWVSTQVRVTAKGMARLSLLIAKEPEPA